MKPWLWLPPQWAHDLSPYLLRIYGFFNETPPPPWRSFIWRNLIFKNRLGIAGGLDKNADGLKAWWSLGAGFIEAGTVTPRPQEPNPGKIMDRHLPANALWNRMGFPSAGAEEVLANLKTYRPYLTPVFVNLGKNRETPNEQAADDYLSLIQIFRETADAFVINISSPNTTGLRELQTRDSLKNLLVPLVDAAGRTGKPLLLKLSPDMGPENLAEAVGTAADAGVDGFVLTNTTLSRPIGIPFPAEGGMSGAPLKSLSLQALEIALKTLGKRREGKLIVSVGGVMTADDVFERLRLGADLVQVYSALVLEGPGFFRKVAVEHESRRT